MRRSKHSDRELPLWRPRRDPLTYVIAALIVVLELPVLAVIALGALVTRAVARVGSWIRASRKHVLSLARAARA